MPKLFLPLIGFLCLGCLISVQGQTTNPPSFDQKNLRLRWELAENNYKRQPQFLSAFTIYNNGPSSLPAKGWSIFFNYILDVRPLSVTGNMTIEHINGDIFRLSPKKEFTGIAPGDSLRIEFVSGDEALNVSDAPSGPYFVWDDKPASAASITAYQVIPLQDSIARSFTPATLFHQNWYVQDIPAGNLPKIFPTPASYKELEGTFLLTSGASIDADRAFIKEAAFLKEKLKPIWSPGSASGKPAIRLIKTPMAAEAYHLDIDANGISIRAGDPAGVFYGIQSLISLLPPTAGSPAQRSIPLPFLAVADAPRFGLRSFMLDIARNFQQKKELLKILDLMALYKLNTLHLHFSDDEGWRIEIASLPELTQIGARRGHTLDSRGMLPASFGDGPDPDNSFGTGHYSRSEFIEILRYAADRHISIIPEIESPGHARAAIKAMDARYERFKAQGKASDGQVFLLRDTNDLSKYSSAQLWTDNVMCPALPSTYQFLSTVTDELIAMYKEAGVPLTTIHFGGDEVPAGVWERSPACQALIRTDPAVPTINDLWYYYYSKINDLLRSKGLFLSGWEELAMRKTILDSNKQLIPNPGFANQHIRVHVWNNMIGAGAEDLPYRLANAGYGIVLSCVSNQYFDLAYNKSPAEPGYYWGGYTDLNKPFSFIPFDYYRNTREDKRGMPIDPATFFLGKDRLTEYGKSNIAGIQGLLWCENVHGPDRLEYMLLPKLLGLAERAWAPDPSWVTEKDPQTAKQLYDQAWSLFANVVGKRELPRLDHFDGGFAYRIPQPGAILQYGKVWANLQLPGLLLRYTTDGTDPTPKSQPYLGPIATKARIRIAAFDTRGRCGMVTEVANNP